MTQELVFVADGARWIWELVALNFPQAVQIVDWYHAVAYLTPIAEALYADEQEAEAWRQRMTAKLWHSDLDEVIATCQALAEHDRAGEAARKAATYYQNNKQRMDYARFRREGYFIGSGTVESGCKQIATMRLKRSGARWTEEGAVTTAKARAAWLSDEWDEVTPPGATYLAPFNNILVLPFYCTGGTIIINEDLVKDSRVRTSTPQRLNNEVGCPLFIKAVLLTSGNQ